MRSPTQHFLLRILTLFAAGTACADPSNIDPSLPYAWSENTGWSSFIGDTDYGVCAGHSYLQGYAWCENTGWLYFGDGTPDGGLLYTQAAGDTGVNRDQTLGTLSGYAWGENIGWVRFDPAGSPHLDLDTHAFSGYAWGENVGWINLASGSGVSILAPCRVGDWSSY